MCRATLQLAHDAPKASLIVQAARPHRHKLKAWLRDPAPDWGNCTMLLSGHTGEVHCQALSPDGKVLVSGSGRVTIMSTEDYTPRQACSDASRIIVCVHV